MRGNVPRSFPSWTARAVPATRCWARPGNHVPAWHATMRWHGDTRGAQTAANAINPDVGIALDVTLTGDVPEARPMAVQLGAGAAIKVKDSGMIAHTGLVRLMRQRAEAAHIPYQLEVLDGGTTDARPMQIAGPGCAAGCISIPCRYVHTPSETVDANDVEHCIQLLVEILRNPIDL